MLTVAEWTLERFDNCLRIAGTKTGADRDSWLEDARYFQSLLTMIADHPESSLPPSQRN